MHEHENVFLTAILVGLLISMVLVSTVLAQAAPVAVDLSKAQFRWTWTQGTGGAVDKFLVRCGPSTGTYIIQNAILNPAARQMAVNQVITAEGTYFCAVFAANAGATSGPSSEASFRAFQVPGAASTFEVFIP